MIHPDPDRVEVREGRTEDLPRIVDILNHAALNSNASFATEPTTVAERRDWFERFSSTGPYRLMVARCDEIVVGYACTNRYRELEAFRETAEVSIALDPAYRSRGVGALLYHALFESLAGEPVHTVLAGIALPNEASVALHRKFGFAEVGTLREYAIKNGEYISSLWMQRLRPAGGW
jgi:phosphinothricin acetyltransferase